jgi:hypothetical protein
MARKGYPSEKKCKDELCKIYGPQNTFKIAIGGAVDFIAIYMGRIVRLVEVKEVHGKNYYAKNSEQQQFLRIKKLAEEHDCIAELWIYKYIPGKRNSVKQIKIIHEPNESDRNEEMQKMQEVLQNWIQS